MIYLNQGQTNQAAAVCSRNSTLTGGTIYYLWKMVHKLSNKPYYFIPFRLQPSVSYTPAYDLFCLDIDDSIPPVLTGATQCGQTNVHLIPGQYELSCYQQFSQSNLIPDLSSGLVYQTLVYMVGTNQNVPVTYTGGTDDIFIIYNPDND
jgi:hypothetical protein